MLKSSDVLGEPSSNGIVYATTQFRNNNPRIVAAFVSGLNEALDSMKKNPRGAAEKYLKMSGDKMNVDEVVKIIADPDATWTSAPQGTFAYASFMHRIGSIKRNAASWKDLFFPEIHDLNGS